MGIVCELYRIPDTEIVKFLEQDIDDVFEFLDENYSSVLGEMHKEGDTVFIMDKAWSPTKYLMKKYDNSPNKTLNCLDKTFIFSEEARQIHEIINGVTIEDLQELADLNELEENNVYRAAAIHNLETIDFHLKTYQAAFKKAFQCKDGIVINYT